MRMNSDRGLLSALVLSIILAPQITVPQGLPKITGTTTLGTKVDTTVIKDINFGRLIGDKQVHLGLLKIDGFSNKATINLSGLELEIDPSTGNGHVIADFIVLRIGIAGKGIEESGTIFLEGTAGPFQIVWEMDFTPGLGAITTSSAKKYSEPHESRLILLDHITNNSHLLAQINVDPTEASKFCSDIKNYYDNPLRIQSEDDVNGTLFTRIYPEYSKGHSIVQASDGGFIVGGSQGLWVLKLTADGHIDWSNFYGLRTDHVKWISQTSDGGYVFTGMINNIPGLVRIKDNGEEVWRKSFGGFGEYSSGACVRELKDGGFIIVGKTSKTHQGSGDVLIIRTDTNGNKLWSRKIGGKNTVERGQCGVQTQDGGFAVTGIHWGRYGGDLLLIKLNQNGDITWERTFGKPANREEGRFLLQCEDGSFLIVGTGSSGSIIVKTDHLGNLLWQKTYGQDWKDRLVCAATTWDRGFVLTGTRSVTSNQNIWLMKINNYGDVIWDHTFRLEEKECQGNALLETKDGDYVICGHSGRSLFILRTNQDGLH